ncbi:MAG TPA: AIR carboxylase family protein, partial [bacterium]|nr:AIR carboxylase family protein [bacterium]
MLRCLAEGLRDGSISVEEGVKRLESLAFEDLGFAHVDHHRRVRRGIPEVVFAQGKPIDQILAIVKSLHEHPGDILVTRCHADAAGALVKTFPGAVRNDVARTVHWKRGEGNREGAKQGAVRLGGEQSDGEHRNRPRLGGKVLVLSAGTSDVPVAEEAAVTAGVFGNEVERVYDVGVAGLHRLLAHGDEIRSASVIIVVAGMEGALPSVVGGLTKVPVIAVPTSTGYGASFGGLAALLAMLN